MSPCPDSGACQYGYCKIERTPTNGFRCIPFFRPPGPTSTASTHSSKPEICKPCSVSHGFRHMARSQITVFKKMDGARHQAHGHLILVTTSQAGLHFSFAIDFVWQGTFRARGPHASPDNAGAGRRDFARQILCCRIVSWSDEPSGSEVCSFGPSTSGCRACCTLLAGMKGCSGHVSFASSDSRYHLPMGPPLGGATCSLLLRRLSPHRYTGCYRKLWYGVLFMSLHAIGCPMNRRAPYALNNTHRNSGILCRIWRSG